MAEYSATQPKHGGYVMMACYRSGCLGNYDFDNIAFFARKRFIEGCDTITLLEQAMCDREKEEIALVSMLDVEDEKIRDLQLSCSHAEKCKVTDCRDRLKIMIEDDLARLN
jgi:hypothetical protein